MSEKELKRLMISPIKTETEQRKLRRKKVVEKYFKGVIKENA